MGSPTQRSLKYMRDQGYLSQVVEKWNPWAHIRQDLFGFIDIISCGNKTTIGIQTTTKSNMSARRKKIRALKEFKIWTAAGNRVQLHGWYKSGLPGKRKTWQVTVEEMQPCEQPEHRSESPHIPTPKG